MSESSRRVAKVLTVSDGVAAGERDDAGGPALVERLTEAGFAIAAAAAVPDGIDVVASALAEMTEGFHGLVVTTGGTGFGPRDLTPEATRHVLEREAPGLGEAMRAASPVPHGMLSRGTAGIRGGALIVNVPGSPTGALECLEAVLAAVPHALDLLGGDTEH